MAITFDSTSDAVREVAQHVCDRFAAGYRGSGTINGVPFEYSDIARCSEFVRECYYAATGHNQGGVYFGGSAKETEQMLRQHGKQVQVSQTGDIVCFNSQAGTWGHIGIVRDGTTYFENTSSVKRGGPGFLVSRFSDIGWSRVTGFYRLLPARVSQEPQTNPVKVIDHATGAVIETLQMVKGGDHIGDQRKVYVVRGGQ